MRPDDEIVVVNPKVAHRGVRKIELERLPMVAIVKGNPNAVFRAGEEQASAHMVFADCVDRRVVRQAARDQLPALAAVSSVPNKAVIGAGPESIFGFE